ncbi:biopolymer transporter TolR [Flavobacteriaceae bacterium F89]|uniref:Biopolymer transporter TolR n=1 Tax=Cerina litoralis TaxID=2874477 RepID=A0AAE3JR11_9FLAO|nr:biopolymer transporter TolR [Cerina litoralis]MCG2462464.1 biopolymer transporter TolR [Cerina litoralis]
MQIRPLLFCLVLSQLLIAQEGHVGIFQRNEDIGGPKLAGSATYDKASQTYSISAAGANIWGTKDEFRYLYNSLEGDFILTANFEFVGENQTHRKMGLMARTSTDDDAEMIGGFLHGNGLTAVQWREVDGAEIKSPNNEILASKRFFSVIQLERKGNRFTLRAAHMGEPLQELGSKVLNTMPKAVFAGIVLCSHDENKLETAKVWNVRIDRPVPEDYDPGKEGWMGCRLETMNVFNGKRKVVHEKDGRFEAPNWMPDGEELLFNMDGSLFTIPVVGGNIKKLNTGSAIGINNDHCISFDGKMLGISSSSGNGSNVYVLPLQGGEPVAVTTESPSYLHGWAPNNKEVVYVAQRNGVKIYDIYKKSIDGGREIKLTANEKWEHVDGCEYSPDGKYIYYNASRRGGTMQLWRMKPDGSQKEQLTFDDYNDWFPHISPNGEWIAFISFEPTIELNSHPSYKRVMLRLMPVNGGAPRVIANLYGGQGTINVNSWSPDSKHLAFVSNSAKKE